MFIDQFGAMCSDSIGNLFISLNVDDTSTIQLVLQSASEPHGVVIASGIECCVNSMFANTVGEIYAGTYTSDTIVKITSGETKPPTAQPTLVPTSSPTYLASNNKYLITRFAGMHLSCYI